MLWVVLHDGQARLELGMVRSPEHLKHQTLEGDQLHSGHLHRLDSDISVMVVHRAACVDHNVHIIVLGEQVECSLSNAYMGFLTVQYNIPAL